jgi:hypothetical protein
MSPGRIFAITGTKSRERGAYTPSKLVYFQSKGYTDDEILEFWHRDLADGKGPVHHKPIPDVVSRIAGK